MQIVEPPKGVRREDWVEPFYQRLGTRFGIAVILKSRENARIAVSYPTASGGNRIEVYTRFVWQYYFYLRDQDWGRMFLRICPYFPFNARICVNQHEWLARRLQEEGVFFRKAANAFVQCSKPDRLQQLADSLTPSDLEVPLQGWLRELVPFYASDDPNRLTDFAYRLFCSQVEYCTNLIFKERAALDRVADRLLDLNRSIGRPDKLSTIFGHRITKAYRGGLKTRIADHHLGNPVIRSEYKDSSVKQYVRDHVLLRNEATSYNTRDLGVGKSIRNLPQLRRVMHGINDRYLAIQQDVLETYVDRGQLARLRQPTITASGRRTPGLKLDDPRLLAVMQALTCFVASQPWRTFPDTRSASTRRRNPRPDHRHLSSESVALRPGQAARQGPGRQSPQDPNLPPHSAGFPDLRLVPETLPPRLRSIQRSRLRAGRR